MEQNEELDPLTLTSDEDDEEEEYFDTFGQRIRPSRADTAPQPVSSEILTSEPSSHSRAETAPLPVSSASPSPIIHLRPSSSSSSPSPIIHLRPSSSSSSSSGSSHSRSRGKGGRKLVVSGNKFQKKKLTPEETAELKRDWRRFLEGYKAELSKILEKDPLSDKFPCNNCDKLVTRQGFIRHLTLQGCSAMKPKENGVIMLRCFQTNLLSYY